MKTFVIAALAVGLLSATPLAAKAQTGNIIFRTDGAMQRVVSVGDLDLNSATGARAALQRIEKAAEEVCGANPAALPLTRPEPFAGCRRAAVDSAVTALGAPLVAALAAPQRGVRLAVH